MHKFVVLLNGELKEYNRFEDIPMQFDNLISFKPCLPEGPHSEKEHDEIETWNDKLKELMKRETR